MPSQKSKPHLYIVYGAESRVRGLGLRSGLETGSGSVSVG